MKSYLGPNAIKRRIMADFSLVANRAGPFLRQKVTCKKGICVGKYWEGAYLKQGEIELWV